MNCREGDLARVICDAHGVTYEMIPGPFTVHIRDRIVQVTTHGKDGWILEAPLWVRISGPECSGSVLIDAIDDEFLRPIRPANGDDETLTWAGRPEQVTA